MKQLKNIKFGNFYKGFTFLWFAFIFSIPHVPAALPVKGHIKTVMGHEVGRRLGVKIDEIWKQTDHYFDSHTYEPVDTIEEAEIVAHYFGVRQYPDFLALPDQRRLGHLNDVFKRMVKLPVDVRNVLHTYGAGVDLVVGSSTNHPIGLEHWENKLRFPHRRKPGDNWTVPPPGLAALDEGIAIIVADHFLESGSIDTILHELGHVFDGALGKATGLHDQEISGRSEFKKIHDKSRWNKLYFDANPEEAFAEGFALYFQSAETRRQLAIDHPEIHLFFESGWRTLKRSIPENHPENRPLPNIDVLGFLKEREVRSSEMTIEEIEANINAVVMIHPRALTASSRNRHILSQGLIGRIISVGPKTITFKGIVNGKPDPGTHTIRIEDIGEISRLSLSNGESLKADSPILRELAVLSHSAQINAKGDKETAQLLIDERTQTIPLVKDQVPELIKTLKPGTNTIVIARTTGEIITGNLIRLGMKSSPDDRPDTPFDADVITKKGYYKFSIGPSDMAYLVGRLPKSRPVKELVEESAKALLSSNQSPAADYVTKKADDWVAFNSLELKDLFQKYGFLPGLPIVVKFNPVVRKPDQKDPVFRLLRLSEFAQDGKVYFADPSHDINHWSSWVSEENYAIDFALIERSTLIEAERLAGARPSTDGFTAIPTIQILKKLNPGDEVRIRYRDSVDDQPKLQQGTYVKMSNHGNAVSLSGEKNIETVPLDKVWIEALEFRPAKIRWKKWDFDTNANWDPESRTKLLSELETIFLSPVNNKKKKYIVIHYYLPNGRTYDLFGVLERKVTETKVPRWVLKNVKGQVVVRDLKIEEAYWGNVWLTTNPKAERLMNYNTSTK